VRGQWLPIDTAFDAATIGGIVATNDAGPLRTDSARRAIC
jgi:FAD/FMN-containing dehydrogenase